FCIISLLLLTTSILIPYTTLFRSGSDSDPGRQDRGRGPEGGCGSGLHLPAACLEVTLRPATRGARAAGTRRQHLLLHANGSLSMRRMVPPWIFSFRPC